MSNLKIEDAIAWQKARVLNRILYEKFYRLKDFGFRDQMLRAVLSIMNNIAEGVESNTGKN